MSSIKTGSQAISAAFADLVRGFEVLGATAQRFGCDAVRAACRLGAGRNSGGCCIDLPSAVLKRADPLIYDQYYLMSMGLAVTWDNPDIDILQGGILVSPWDLKRATDYEVRLRVWNGSYDAPAIGLPVDLSFLSFGIGTTSTAVGSANIDLGPKGSASAPSFASIHWTTPAQPGHYCLQARLIWPDDANPDNNLGQKNTQVGQAHSPAVIEFALRNDATVRRDFDFEVDAYAIPPLAACPPPRPPAGARGTSRVAAVGRPGRLAESRARWAEALAAQGYGRFPVAPGWAVTFDPARPLLAPGQEITVRATIEPPAGWAGRQAFNVHGFAKAPERRRLLAGGVTLIIERS